MIAALALAAALGLGDQGPAHAAPDLALLELARVDDGAEHDERCGAPSFVTPLRGGARVIAGGLEHVSPAPVGEGPPTATRCPRAISRRGTGSDSSPARPAR